VTPSQEANITKAREEFAAGKEEHAKRRILAALPGVSPEEVLRILKPPAADERAERNDAKIAAAAEAAMLFDDYTMAVIELFKHMPAQRKSIKNEDLSSSEVMNICSEITEQIGYLILCNKNPTEIFRTFFTTLMAVGFDKATGAAILKANDTRKDAWISNLDCMSNPALRSQIQDALKKTLEESNLTDDLIKSL
jgi:hypothetical protein